MHDTHDICAILDRWTQDRCACASVGLWTDGAAAMQAALIDRADDLRVVAALLDDADDDDVQALVRLLRTVANQAQVCARTVEIAHRTGRRVAANRAQSDAEE